MNRDMTPPCPIIRPHEAHTYGEGRFDCYGIDEPAPRPRPRNVRQLQTASDGLERALYLTDHPWMPAEARRLIKAGVAAFDRLIDQRPRGVDSDTVGALLDGLAGDPTIGEMACDGPTPEMCTVHGEYLRGALDRDDAGQCIYRRAHVLLVESGIRS